MRIFVNSTHQTGTRHNTRILLHNCASTSQLTREICKQFGIPRSFAMIKLKGEPVNLVIIDNWPLQHYPIKSGTTFTMETIQCSIKQNELLAMPLEKIDQELINEQLDEGQTSPSYSSKSSKKTLFQSNRIQLKYSHYLEQSLNRMLQLVRNGRLQDISTLMREEPPIDNQKELQQLCLKKYQFLLNQNGDCGRNALHWAIHTNQIEVASFLLIKGANTSRLTIDEYTPLQLAVQLHSLQIVSLLLQQHNFNVDQATKHGTALHLAIKNEDLKCIQILIKNDCSLDIRDGQGKLALDLCKNEKIRRIITGKIDRGQLALVNTTKGPIYRVSTRTFRLKQRILLLNPFRNEFTISTSIGEVQYKYSFDKINDVFQIKEKNWFMKKHLFYFKIFLKDKEKDILVATKHANVFQRWVKNIRAAIKYQEYKLYTKYHSKTEQVLQILDDQKGQIYHQFKAQQKSSKKTQSILNLNYSCEDQQQSQNLQAISNLAEKCDISIPDINNSNEAQQQKGNLSFQENLLLMTKVHVQQSFQQNSQTLDNSQKRQSQKLLMASVKQNQQKTRFVKNSDCVIISQKQPQPSQSHTISYSDFQVIKLLGSGAFGKVYLACYRRNGQNYALKVLNKKKLYLKKQLKYAVGQANTLKKLDSPFIVRLHYSFQTPNNLYMALDHCSMGDLSELIINKEKLQQSTARFVIAQLTLAIQYLHSLKILYRDLKPQNILIASDGYIRLTDFGLSRQHSFATSFCGSPAYLSPQMLQKKGVGKSTDIYGIGCVLYEMVVGQPPFFDENMEVLFSNIRSGKLKFPSELSSQIKSLINCLLQRDLTKRLGVQNMNEIKKHSFFNKIDWQLLKCKKIKAPDEMFANFEQVGESAQIELQINQKINLVDRDYTEENKMINFVRKFTYAREEERKNQKSFSKNRKQII